MNEDFEKLKTLLSVEHLQIAVRVGVLILLILPFCFIVANWLRSFVTKRFSAQQGLVAGKIVRYLSVILVTIIVFNELGFSIAPLLGAAGIVGVALAFASQTSVSNVISGLFLIAERPFEVGDAINVGGTTGVVLSIDTLSVKLRTFANKFVRIPNETILKTEVTNITRFPIRRLDIAVGVSYNSDLKHVRETLLNLAELNPLCLMEPKPVLLPGGFGDSSIDMTIGFWVTKENFLELKQQMFEEIKKRFDDEEIEIPFPQRTVWIKENQTGDEAPI